LSPMPLVGRERELKAVVARPSRPDVRPVTLTGAGGVGKTRLAITAAEIAEKLFADGVRFVDDLAIAAGGTGHDARAVRLFGALQSLSEAMDLPFPPFDHATSGYDASVA